MEHKKVLPDTAVIRFDMKAKQKAELPDDMLTSVAGGYTETEGWSAGWEVSCPNCGASEYGQFDCWVESEDDCLDGFKCRLCGTVFGIDRWGRIWGDL